MTEKLPYMKDRMNQQGPTIEDDTEFRVRKNLFIIEVARGDGNGFAWGVVRREYDPFGEFAAIQKDLSMYWG